MNGNGPQRMLIISNVKPYPGKAGQQRRVHNKIVALRRFFDITFLTIAWPREVSQTCQRLAPVVDHAIVLESIIQKSMVSRIWHKLIGELYALANGLKKSNYVLGEVELSPKRIAANCKPADYDLVLYEYWHSVNSTVIFQRHGVPCVLDMHDVLWQSYDRQLATHPYPWMRAWRSRLVRAYRRREEAAWARYDALIAISEGEADYARSVVPDKPIFVAPMGTDLAQWPYCWSPVTPPRLGFYGSLGSWLNQESVMWCIQKIMPLIWQEMPDVEFWVVGANPPLEIQNLQSDGRVHVTGFVPDVGEVLATMTAVLCPWRGTYGFRSRLIEVMALGVPVVATPDAVYGMGMDVNKGLLLAEADEELAEHCLTLIGKPDWAQRQSRLARQQVEEKFSFEATYGQLAKDLYEFVCGFNG